MYFNFSLKDEDLLLLQSNSLENVFLRLLFIWVIFYDTDIFILLKAKQFVSVSFQMYFSRMEATDVPLICHRAVHTSTSRRDTLAPILNYDEQTKTAHPTQQQLLPVGGIQTAGITLTNKPCQSGAHHTSIYLERLNTQGGACSSPHWGNINGLSLEM